MNTKSICSGHEELYKKLYAHHEVVVSAPFTASVVGKDQSNDPRLSCPVTLRAHVGVVKTHKKGIVITSYKEYDPVSDTFIPSQLLLSESDQDCLQSVCDSMELEGVAIEIVSQLPMHFGLGGEKFLIELICSACKLLGGDPLKNYTNTQTASHSLPMDIAVFYTGTPSSCSRIYPPQNQSQTKKLVEPLIEQLIDLYHKLGDENYNTLDVYQFIKYTHIVGSIVHHDTFPRSYSNLLIGDLHQLLLQVTRSIVPYCHEVCGGCLMLLSPLHYLKSKMQDIGDIIGKYGGSVIYYSGIDGYETRGMRIEHFPSAKIIHESVNNFTIKVKDNQNITTLYDSIEQSVLNYDILVDCRQGKLFVAGKKLSSLELASQQYTAYVLEKHITQKLYSLSSSVLPMSSYSKSKSEFMGKIVNPFQKLIQQRIGKPFTMVCKGQGSTFTVDLSYEDLSIGCISG